MEDENQNKNKSSSVAIKFFTAVMIASVIFIIIFSNTKTPVLSVIPGILFFVSIIALIAIVSGNRANKKEEEAANSTRNYSYESNNSKRVVVDDFLQDVDNYVAKTFPELPFDEAKIIIPYDDNYLNRVKKTAFEMQKHIGLGSFIISISIRTLNNENAKRIEAGHFKRDNLMSASIEIDSNLSESMMLACLAHEMSHAYQSFKGKQPYPDSTDEEEKFTDLLTFYLGFSSYIKNGYYSYNMKLGYAEAGDFERIEKLYSSRTSSSGSYQKEKKELKELILLYESLVDQVVNMCESLLHKYMSPDDKKFVSDIYEKYSNHEVKDYISKIKDNIDRRAKLNVNMDQIGVEIKIEDLMKDKEKVQRIYDYITNK